MSDFINEHLTLILMITSFFAGFGACLFVVLNIRDTKNGDYSCPQCGCGNVEISKKLYCPDCNQEFEIY